MRVSQARRCVIGMLLGFSLVVAVPMAAADIIDLDPGVGFFRTGGPGTGRSMYILANEDFSISAVGVLGDLVEQSFDVVIYAGKGEQNPPGAELEKVSATAGGIGFDWNDLEIEFSFDAGEEYLINWRPSSSNNRWATQLEYTNSWGNPLDDGVDLGPLTILDGRENWNGTSWTNTLAAHMRINTSGGGCDPCDANCDGSVDLTDIEPFIGLLFGDEPCNFCTGDTNDDGSIDLTDIEGFIACLLG